MDFLVCCIKNLKTKPAIKYSMFFNNLSAFIKFITSITSLGENVFSVSQ